MRLNENVKIYKCRSFISWKHIFMNFHDIQVKIWENQYKWLQVIQIDKLINVKTIQDLTR